MSTKWWSPRAIGLHLTLAICEPGFLAAFWWQFGRARSGNELSWAYTFEWPLFALYALYLWWRLIHESPEDPPREHASARRARRKQWGADTDEEAAAAELAAYNAYLASLREETEQHSRPV